MKKLTLLAAASTITLLTTQASASYYAISYDFVTESLYTSSQPLHMSGTPDADQLLGIPDPTVHGIPSTPVTGYGYLDTSLGVIYLGSIDYEINITSGSVGYANWSQTLTGSFSGTAFTMTSATTNSGSLVCEDQATVACDAFGGIGQPPQALLPPQLYTPPVLDILGNTVIPGGPVIDLNIDFDYIGEGGKGTYRFESDMEPAYEDTIINITILPNELPIPGAAWLFGSGLLALGYTAKQQRKH